MPLPLPASAWVLLAANLLPLVGVIALGWRVEPILWLYWLENLVVGGFTLIRMLFARGAWPLKAFLLPFFTIHFGMFCMVHGMFLAILMEGHGRTSGIPDPPGLIGRALAFGPVVALPLTALGASHLVSFLLHDVRGGRLTTSDVSLEMFRPYGRIFLMHFVVLLGAGFAAALGSPLPALVVLVLIKLGIDVAVHVRSHRPAPTARIGDVA